MYIQVAGSSTMCVVTLDSRHGIYLHIYTYLYIYMTLIALGNNPIYTPYPLIHITTLINYPDNPDKPVLIS